MKKSQSITTTANIAPTPQDKGVVLTIRVKAYDNGMIEVDDRPVNRNAVEAQGYLSAMATISEKLDLLRRASTMRRTS